MEIQPKQPATGPVVIAYCHMLYCAFLSMRSNPNMSRDQLFDLADALHNIPHFLLRFPEWKEADIRRVDLEPYDRKWAANGPGCLVAWVEEGLRKYQSKS